MAQRVQVILVCDLHDDDTAGTETVSFALDGNRYEIDVCEAHGAELRDGFARYVGAARRATGRPGQPSGSGRRRRRGNSDAGRIREWARGQGLQVPSRGRIPADIASQYAAANPR
jgi:hypothetical protein